MSLDDSHLNARPLKEPTQPAENKEPDKGLPQQVTWPPHAASVDFRAISAKRKLQPIFDGFIMYFPDAMAMVAEFSRVNNEKHNPGEHLHWSKHKSNDHANCIGRHLKDIGPEWDEIDPESNMYHACALAWRSNALLQIVIEAARKGMKVSAYLKMLERGAK